MRPEKLIELLDLAVSDIFDQQLYDELMEAESEDQELFRAEMKNYVDNEL